MTHELIALIRSDDLGKQIARLRAQMVARRSLVRAVEILMAIGVSFAAAAHYVARFA